MTSGKAATKAKQKPAPRKKATNATPKKGKKGRRDWRALFLEALRRSPSVSTAARMAQISRQHVYKARAADAEFAAAWDDALEQAVDDLVAAAWKRARGKSDVLAIFLLKAHRPEVYRERIEVDDRRIDEEIKRELAELAAIGQAKTAGEPAGAETAGVEPPAAGSAEV